MGRGQKPGATRGTIKKGEVRNPTGENGRKKEARELQALIVQFLDEKITDGAGRERSRLEWLVEMLYARTMKGSAPHMQELLNRGFGRPVQPISGSGIIPAILVVPDDGSSAD